MYILAMVGLPHYWGGELASDNHAVRLHYKHSNDLGVAVNAMLLTHIRKSLSIYTWPLKFLNLQMVTMLHICPKASH